MASTHTSALLLEKQATGENSNTWGTALNSTLDLIDDAIADNLSKSVAGSSDVTLTDAEAVHMWHEYTGALTGSINVIVPSREKLYFIYNNTSGAFTLTVKTSAGTGIEVKQGYKGLLYCDATNVINAGPTQLAENLNLNSNALVDAYGNELLTFASGSTSATNQLKVTNSSGGVTLQSSGGATDIDVNLDAQGSGVLNLNAPVASTGTVTVGGVLAASTAVNLTGLVTLSTNLAMGDNEVQRPILKDYGEAHISLTSSTNTVVDCSSANSFDITISAATTFTFANPTPTSNLGGMTVFITQPSTALGVTWPVVNWPSGTTPASTTASKTYIFEFATHDAGTTWYGFRAGAEMST